MTGVVSPYSSKKPFADNVPACILGMSTIWSSFLDVLQKKRATRDSVPRTRKKNVAVRIHFRSSLYFRLFRDERTWLYMEEVRAVPLLRYYCPPPRPQTSIRKNSLQLSLCTSKLFVFFVVCARAILIQDHKIEPTRRHSKPHNHTMN